MSLIKILQINPIIIGKILELIPHPLRLERDGVILKVPLFLREGFRVSFFITIFLFSTPIVSLAQSTRGLINDGVDYYLNQNYVDAEVNFKKVSEQSPENFEAKFNLGDAFYKQQKHDEAIKSFQNSLASAKNDIDKANVYYNIGNSLLKSNQLDQSIAAYKESLKLNPDDMDAKYNLSYALTQKNNPEENQQQQAPEQKISKEEAKRILEALKDNEKDLQKELRKVKSQKIKTEKDW